MTDIAQAIGRLSQLAMPSRPTMPRPIADAFDREERFGIRLVTYARTLAVALILIWVIIQNLDFGPVGVGYFAGLLVLFALLGLAHYALATSRFRRPWHKFAFLTLDVVYLTYLFVQPYPFNTEPFPVPMMLRFGNFLYFFVVLSQAVLIFSPALALWFGANVLVFWSAGVASVMLRGGDFYLESSGPQPPPMADQIAVMLQPDFVHLDVFITQLVVIAVTSTIVALAVWRARRLVYREAEAQRARTNLARYFSPNLVQELSGADEALAEGRSQQAAVLFADIVGFTSLSERLPPAQTMALLRGYHARMTEAVFAHGGTLDKFIGDEIMATFGTPKPGPRDAANALACARAMLKVIAGWNEQRVRDGESPIRIGIGVHFGTVVLGDIGAEQRFEFAVIGDTVNVASRLERLSRDVNAAVVASDSLVRQVRRELGAAAEPLLLDFVSSPAHELRGRREAVDIWTM
jgi:adenylate cyclase